MPISVLPALWSAYPFSRSMSRRTTSSVTGATVSTHATVLFLLPDFNDQRSRCLLSSRSVIGYNSLVTEHC